MPLPGKIRIIAGQWRGRKLEVVDAPGLRPSPDRIRETLFNWLQADIPGSRCLDLFAGTGALGFEALSRGAAEVLMVEANAALVDKLNEQALRFGSQQHVIRQADALSWLTKTAKQFDIIFLDPPFKQGLLDSCCQIIKERDLLDPRGKIYVEAEKGLALPEGWEILKQKQAGQVQSVLLTRQEDKHGHSNLSRYV